MMIPENSGVSCCSESFDKSNDKSKEFSSSSSCCWISKPAIRWMKNENDHNNDQNSCCAYWNKEVIKAIQTSLMTRKEQQEGEVVHNDQEHDVCKDNDDMTKDDYDQISYGSLIYVASLIVKDFRRQLYKDVVVKEHRQYMTKANRTTERSDADILDDDTVVLGVPIVVAIPEGPLLPLATLIVHALNVPFNSIIDYYDDDDDDDNIPTSYTTAETMKLSAIFVPIEQHEAKERNINILKDVKPMKILTVPGKDMDQLQNLLLMSMNDDETAIASSEQQQQQQPKMITTNTSNNKDGLKYHYQYVSNTTTSPDLINFEELILSTLKRNSSLTLTKSFKSLLTDTRLNRCDIQSLVAIGSDYCCYHQSNLTADNDENDAIVPPDSFLDKYLPSESNDDNHIVRPVPNSNQNRISHIVFTSGTTGRPKGCISSIQALQHYLKAKNEVHCIGDTTASNRDASSESTTTTTTTTTSVVLLASSISFDPCFSDIVATFQSKSATLAIAKRKSLLSDLTTLLKSLKVSHILCTPTLWSLVDGERPKDFPFLRVIALGGEPIPRSIRKAWARTTAKVVDGTNETAFKKANSSSNRCRLFATYGVTEACVYQTLGEEMLKSSTEENPSLGGQVVGHPFPGISIRICDETNQDSLEDVEPGHQGEVVITGNQCDEFTNYLNRPTLKYKFVVTEESQDSLMANRYHYRTGDRGIINPMDRTLTIIGRIAGEEGMVKINGVRVELGEIESAVIDDALEEHTNSNCSSSTNTSLVRNCCARYIDGNENHEETGRSEIQVFCILSDTSLAEFGIQNADKSKTAASGIFMNGGPLLELLRARCSQRIKAACMPSSFVIIPRLPLSPTGKLDRNGLPNLDVCIPMNGGDQDPNSIPLKEYGRTGKILAENIIDCLNLQPAQESMVTTSVTFSMLGGDSLGATRVIRALYAFHHGVNNNRFLGGAFGKLDGPFDVIHLLRAKTLKEYVDMLDRNGIGLNHHEVEVALRVVETETASQQVDEETEQNSRLYDALLQATTLGHFAVAIALLDVGADPTFGEHGGRLGKVSGRREQKTIFRSSPLHLACLKGHPELVRNLLRKGAKPNTPDASGLFPLHLAASGMNGEVSNESEDCKRLECVKALFAAGVPITMRDGNKQSVLHAAARAGHSKLLREVMTECDIEYGDGNGVDRYFQWRDRWCRTPVHWAVLNNRKEALRVLLELGCDPNPQLPKVNNRSSAAVESPMELCERLYGHEETTEKGADIRALLLASINRASKKAH